MNANSKDDQKVVEEQEDDLDMAEFLDTLVGENEPTIDIGAHKEVAIKRATAAELYNILDLVRGLIKTLGITNLTEMEKAIKEIEDPGLFMTILMESHDRTFKLIYALCNLTDEEVMALEIDHLLVLVMAEWKVNERFFTERVMGLVANLFPPSLDTKQ